MGDLATECRFCGGPLEEEERASGTCDGCWYGMRLEPDEWALRMAALGRPVTHRGGCVHAGRAIVCRDPYVPGEVRISRRARRHEVVRLALAMRAMRRGPRSTPPQAKEPSNG